jgi:hypothetical protein
LNDLVLFLFMIRFWMAFDKVRIVSTNNKISIPLFSVLVWEATRNFSSVCGMVVEKSNVLMLLQIYWDLELKVSSKSFEFFNIHFWLTALLEKQVSWYFCSIISNWLDKIKWNTIKLNEISKYQYFWELN